MQLGGRSEDETDECSRQDHVCSPSRLGLRRLGARGDGLGSAKRPERASGQPHLSQKLHDDLTKAGFTDITIMPSSFLVRAKDSQGNPVMMVINPDSLTEVTEQTTEHQEAPLAGAIKGATEQPNPLARSEAVTGAASRQRNYESRP